jgi:hypothetical protein
MKHHKKLPKLRKGAWFYKVRASYLPATWQGWLTYIPYIAYIIASLVYVIDTTHSLLGVIVTVVPYWAIALAIMTWIAWKKS